MAKDTQPYAGNGVVLSKATLYVGDTVTLSYSGLLVASGADQIYAHIGYNENWEERAFVPMNNEDGVFVAPVKILLPGKLNISFKDSASNWDNNSSENYVFKTSKKAAKADKAGDVKEEKAAVKPAKKAEKPAAKAAKKEEKAAVEAPKKEKAVRKKKSE